MSIDQVKDFLRQWNMEDRIREFETSSATVELAAKALNCEPQRIAKTLAFMVSGKCVLVVAAGDARIDNAKFKQRFEVKAKMLAPEEVVEFTGHAIGGVCPFALKDGVITYLDSSLKRFKTVFPACGSSSSAIELSIGELERFSRAESWVDVCKGWS